MTGKFAWKRAFDAVAIPEGYSAKAIVLASRLADHCNTKTGRCDPGYDVLAKGMGVGRKTVQRAVKELEQGGWIKRTLGGPDDNVSFTLCIVDNMLSTMDAVTKPKSDAPYWTDSASIPDRQGVHTYEQGTRSAPSGLSAPQARSTARVERVSMSQHLTAASS